MAHNVLQARDVHGGVHFHDPGWAMPVPRQLPPDVPHFTDRENHLARLHSWLDVPDSEASPVEVVAGIGGVGKTSLVTHWAHRVRDRFVDGDVFLDLRGYHRERAVTAADGLDRVLRALGTPNELIPADVDARAALYRTLLHNRKMLILLDNASSCEQVRPLLPGTATCRVVITSRNHLVGLAAGNGAHRMPLDVLPPERALELLRQVVGDERVDAEPAAADLLAAYCGYLPLALRIAAERLASSAHTSVEDLVEELAEVRERLDVLTSGDDESAAVRVVFSWSYDALSPDAARAFRLLGLMPGQDIGLSAAAALLDLTEGRARRLLAELTSVHMLTEKPGRRYQFHDLLRLHAVERVETREPEADRRAATRRLLVWYAHSLRAAVRVIMPYYTTIPVELPATTAAVPAFADRRAALQWCDAEQPNLMAAVAQASATGQHDLAWRLPVLMFGLLLTRKPLVDWVTTHDIGIASARAAGDVAAEAWLLTSVGIARRELRQSEPVLAELERALLCWQRVGIRWGEAWALRDTGATLNGLGRHAEAIGMFQRALAMHLEDGDAWGEATALSGLSHAHLETGETRLALEESLRALEIRREQGDQRNVGNALNTVGEVYLALGDVDRAVDHVENAMTVLTEVDYRGGRAVSHQLLGAALSRRGREDEAATHRRLAVELYESIGDPRADDVRAHLTR
ncbi:ATP-binding protein [Saccharothrix sp. Mg75]|uniref:ATP-binding protein n=1 Tax=Saccharothrix sp. Mg75 TaxID=3445357 RepID=UPI003EEA0A46